MSDNAENGHMGLFGCDALSLLTTLEWSFVRRMPMDSLQPSMHLNAAPCAWCQAVRQGCLQTKEGTGLSEIAPLPLANSTAGSITPAGSAAAHRE